MGGITRNNVMIVGTVQVTAGGWMPILQIFDPTIAAPGPTDVTRHTTITSVTSPTVERGRRVR